MPNNHPILDFLNLTTWAPNYKKSLKALPYVLKDQPVPGELVPGVPTIAERVEGIKEGIRDFGQQPPEEAALSFMPMGMTKAQTGSIFKGWLDDIVGRYRSGQYVGKPNLEGHLNRLKARDLDIILSDYGTSLKELPGTTKQQKIWEFLQDMSVADLIPDLAANVRTNYPVYNAHMMADLISILPSRSRSPAAKEL